MTRIIPALLACAAVLLVSACGGGTPASTSSSSSATTTSTTPSVDAAAEEKAIRQVFADYREAARAKDGPAAAELLSQGVLDYYAEARDLALTGSEQQLGDRDVALVLVVYMLRAEFDAAELRGMSGKHLVSAAVERGLAGENSTDVVDLGTVVVDGDTATAEMISPGKSLVVELLFDKEDGSWRFDFRPLIAPVGEALENVAEQRGMTVDQFIDAMLGSLYGAERVPELKKPLAG
ncbi:hypothetical protein [Saccharothrix sp. HUAS TT1]|uniref:hypothetical protein n=1 Tax=unclassified Saccharothrix TaxID=2593673 RepID=UPI00345B6AA6